MCTTHQDKRSVDVPRDNSPTKPKKLETAAPQAQVAFALASTQTFSHPFTTNSLGTSSICYLIRTPSPKFCPLYYSDTFISALVLTSCAVLLTMSAATPVEINTTLAWVCWHDAGRGSMIFQIRATVQVWTSGHPSNKHSSNISTFAHLVIPVGDERYVALPQDLCRDGSIKPGDYLYLRAEIKLEGQSQNLADHPLPWARVPYPCHRFCSAIASTSGRRLECSRSTRGKSFRANTACLCTGWGCGCF